MVSFDSDHSGGDGALLLFFKVSLFPTFSSLSPAGYRSVGEGSSGKDFCGPWLMARSVFEDLSIFSIGTVVVSVDYHGRVVLAWRA